MGAYASADQALDAICTKLQCTKVCHTTDDRTQCFHTGVDWYTLDGRVGYTDYSSISNEASATVVDGMAFAWGWWTNCNGSDGGITDICAVLAIDTNGFKKPNKMGRDMFELYVEPNKVEPNGVRMDASEFCDPSSTTTQFNGCTCGARITIQGGMNY